MFIIKMKKVFKKMDDFKLKCKYIFFSIDLDIFCTYKKRIYRIFTCRKIVNLF